jgi:hypothetical protein
VVPGYFGLIRNKKINFGLSWTDGELNNNTEVTITTDDNFNKVTKSYICKGAVSNTGKKKLRTDSGDSTNYKSDQGDTTFHLKVKDTHKPLQLTKVNITGCEHGATSNQVFNWLYNTVPK